MAEKVVQEQIRYSKSEEMTNVLTHAVGAVLALIGAILALVKAVKLSYDSLAIFAIVVYGIAMFCMFTVSSLYHFLKYGTAARAVFRRLDHCSISILIFGTYAPIVLIGMTNGSQADTIWAYCIFAVVAVMAILSIIFNAINVTRFKVFCMIAYIVMGWACVVRLDLVYKLCGLDALMFILGGGLAYTGGIAFYAIKKIPFNHAIWHFFVLAGAALHFVCVYCYLLV